MSATVSSALLTGCSSDSTSSSITQVDTIVTSDRTTQVGYFVDSAVINADYDCIADGDYNKTTGEDGRFECETMSQVRFRVGNLIIGDIDALPDDGYVFPQDLVPGVSRDDTNNSDVLAIAKLLQAIDADDNLSNGIEIKDDTKESIVQDEYGVHHEFDRNRLYEYLLNVGITDDNDILTDYEAEKHLRETVQMHSKGGVEEHNQNIDDRGYGYDSDEYDRNIQTDTGNADGEYGQDVDNGYDGYEYNDTTQTNSGYNQDVNNSDCNGSVQGDVGAHGQDINNSSQGYVNLGTEMYTLSQDLKDAIAYMGNEERLAHDIYMKLYSKYSNTEYGDTIYALYNIATRSEAKHVSTIQAIVRKYSLTSDDLTNISTPVVDDGINTPIDGLPAGKYGISKIQSLYDALESKGSESAQDALEVGCMVEVTDINDLNDYIDLAESDEAQDVVDAFTVLRNASYEHYWAFDQGLRNMGVDDGCCSLGIIGEVDYCHSEYPKNGNDM